MGKKKADNITLDAKHNEMKIKFQQQYKKLSSMKNKLKKLENKKKSFAKKEYYLEDYFTLENKIEKLKKDINSIENKEDFWEYYSNTSNILYEYHDTIKSVSKNIFEKKKEGTTNRANILEKYNNCVDKTHLSYDNVDKKFYYCKKCNKDKIINKSDAIVICETCGEFDLLFLENDRNSYKNMNYDSSNSYSYKRINHLQEWLSKFQAKETIDIPDEVYNDIMGEIKKERITDLSILTRQKIREYLKKLSKTKKYSKYYDHVAYILYRITGKEPPRLPKKLEEKFKEMFKDIEDAFVKLCPKNRKNFLSYPYVLYKLMEMDNLDEYKNCFQLLKSREKLHQQDLIWRKICESLGWKFIKSV